MAIIMIMIIHIYIYIYIYICIHLEVARVLLVEVLEALPVRPLPQVSVVVGHAIVYDFRLSLFNGFRVATAPPVSNRWKL